MRKKRLKQLVAPAPRKSYYDPKTGIMTLHPPEQGVTFGDALAHAQARLGGKEGLAHWAQYNPGHFYTLLARTLPLELAGKGGGPLEFTIVDPTIQERPKEKLIGSSTAKTNGKSHAAR